MTAGLAADQLLRGEQAAAATGETPGVNVLFVCVANSGRPRKLDDEALAWADVAVSTCTEEVCRVITGVRRISWQLPDPTNLPLEDVREVRDDIDRRVTALAADLDAEQA